mmetsp:Transcript_22381/g.40014  ORF Transcript_22381/g.40014 Transcript_22381/m.40014 type:complete len:202 (+) Transcript_22381:280-885(+)|eukprot:CAMPEP_0205925080 /NCGR_PEP_ID=MMETSP1325-20131115/17344_1 /ASSEMBLY_ACC=CAM_ASM_000708 /TAXON_ID=236786 /ORGANISM="Florenciella sp., Strain RCC1007" /LENGTH=201 /DNA_ID=CAMNT_0053293539 /DNA_START=313 /DNA_END=918 /DNA_ORIENTATION=-
MNECGAPLSPPLVAISDSVFDVARAAAAPTVGFELMACPDARTTCRCHAERFSCLVCARISSACACRSSQLDVRAISGRSIGVDGSDASNGGWRGPVEGLGTAAPAAPFPGPASPNGLFKAVARPRIKPTTLDDRRFFARDVLEEVEAGRPTLEPESFLCSLCCERLRLLAEFIKWILLLDKRLPPRNAGSDGGPKSYGFR